MIGADSQDVPLTPENLVSCRALPSSLKHAPGSCNGQHDSLISTSAESWLPNQLLCLGKPHFSVIYRYIPSAAQGPNGACIGRVAVPCAICICRRPWTRGATFLATRVPAAAGLGAANDQSAPEITQLRSVGLHGHGAARLSVDQSRVPAGPRLSAVTV